MSVIASIGVWLVKTVLKLNSAGVIEKALGALTGSADGRIKLAEIQAGAAVALKREETSQLATHTAALNERQRLKMNQPVFWIIIAIMMGPPALMLWGVSIYNFLWWEHGIWPQAWAIADFPPSIKPWVQRSIDWLYDPLGAPSTVGAAGLASFVTGKRQ